MPAPLRPFHVLPLILLAWVVPAARGQTITEALDAPALTWNNPAGTLVQNDVTFDGVDAVRLTRTGTTALSATLTGPARVEMKVRTSTEANADWFEASVGGLVQARLSGEQPWQKVTLDVPAGSQRVDLFYRKDAMTTHGADSVWVDAVEVLPAAPLSIAEAVDANFAGDITVTTAAAEWFTLPTAELSAEGGDVLVLAPSPATATTAAARLRLPVTGRGRLTMELNFFGTGTPTYVRPEWPLRELAQFQTTLEAGRYVTLEFIQPLNAPVPAVELVIPIPANMMALVDKVRWTPLAGISVGAALEAEALPWLSAGGVLAVASAADAQDGVDAVLFYDATASVALPLTGPAQVAWVSRNSPNFSVDGSPRTGTQMAALPDGWSRHSYLVPSGGHTLRWQTAGTLSASFDQHGRLDQVTVTPLTVVSIPEALDAPGLPWTTVPDSRLTGIGGDPAAVEGGDVVRMDAVMVTSGDWLETSGSGAGRLHFAWGGAMTCAVNGVSALTSPGISPLTRGVVEIPSGAWTARWTTGSSSTLIPGLDAVSFFAGESETLRSITDCTGGVSVVAARGQHFAGPVNDHAGVPGRQLLMEGSPSLTLETTGNGVLRLRVWAAAGAVYSWGSGQQQAGSGGWQDLDISLSPASVTVPVRTTLSMFSVNAFAVDTITWTTGSLFPAEEALDTPGVTWTESHTGGTDGWLGRPVALSVNAGDVDAMLVPVMTGPAQASLTATLTGSGWLTFTRLTPPGVTFTVQANGEALFSDGFTSGNWQREYVELRSPGPQAVVITVSRSSGTTSSATGLGGVSILPWLTVSDGTAAEVPAGVATRTSPQRPFRAVLLSGDPEHPHLLEAPASTTVGAVLDFEVNGPGWLSFAARGSRVLLDGGPAVSLSPGAWNPVLLSLPPGIHKVQLVADANATGSVDNFLFQSAAAQTFGEALDQPTWTWTAQGSWGASVPGTLAHDGADAVAFTGAGSSTGSLRTPWPGAGLLSFWWKRTGNGPPLTFTAGSETRSQSLQDEWHRDFIELPAAGGTELVWSAANGLAFGSTAHLLVDDVRLYTYSSVSLAEALDTPGRVWTTGTPAWQTLDDGPAPGDAADYAICPPVDGLRWVETAVTHPAWVEYDVVTGMPAVSLEAPGAGVNATLVLQPSQNGTAPGWVRRRVFTGGSGAGTLRFSGLDSAPNFQARLVDRVFISEAVSATEALDSPVPWENSYTGGEGAGFRLPRPLEGGDAVVVQTGAYSGELSTTLTGPGEFSLRFLTEWETAPGPGNIVARVFLEGAVVRGITAAAGWHEVRHRVPAGPHRLSLRNVRLGTGQLLLDDFRFTAGGTDDVALALDLPGSYGSAGSAWTTHADAAATGGTALRTPVDAAAGSLSTAVLIFTGPGSLGFSWQFSGAEGAAFSLLLDGEPFWTAPPAAAWTTVALPVPRAGEHTLTLQWQPGAAGGFALMDALTLTPFAAVSVAEALDTPGRTWEAKNCDGVAGAAASTVNGDALRMTAAPEWNEEASLATTVTGPARVSFRWYRGGAGNTPNFSPPILAFSVPGLGSILAAKVQHWEEVSMDVPSGTITLEWRAHASSGASPLSALVDDVRITPVTLPVSLAAALDVPAGVNVSGNTIAWRMVTAPSVQGNDAVIGTVSGTPLNITCSGAGELEFTCSLQSNAQPAVNLASGSLPPVETVWRQPGALYGLDVGRFRLAFALPGSRTVSFFSSSNAGLFMLDDVAWRPSAALTLAEALDTPGRTWTSSGSPPWQALPFRPNRVSPAAGDVTFVGGSGSSLVTTFTGAHAVAVSGVEGGTVKAQVNDTETGDDIGMDTLYLLLPGTQTLRIMPTWTVIGDGLSIDTVHVTPNPPPPAWLAGAGVTVTMGAGLWRSQPARGTVPAPALLGFVSGGTTPALTAQVEGAGALEFYANGGSLAVDDVLKVTLAASGFWQRHRVELPAAGPHTITFSFNYTGVADLRWTPGAPVLAAACGLTGAALFSPSDAITVLAGGGVCVDVPVTRAGLIATESNEPALFTWWQQAATPDQVRSSGALNAFTLSSAAEAGPAPAPANGFPWSPRRMFWPVAPSSMTWQLTGSVCIGNIRRTLQTVTLDEALELPAGVTAAAVAPGSAIGYSLTSAGGDAVGLRFGEERALLLAASGPGILSYYTRSGSLRITAGTLPPVDVLNGFGHVLLGPGPQTVALGNQPGAATVALVDSVALLPLAFDPIAALGGAQPMVVFSGTEPSAWPLVISGGTGGMSFPGTQSLYTAVGGPARISFDSSFGAVTGLTNYITPPAQLEQLWPAGIQFLWLDRAASVRIFAGYGNLLTSVDNVRLDAAPAVTFPQALDANGLTFTASAGVLAHALPQGAVFDGDAVAFALGTAPRTLQTSLTGPGRLRFWWRTLTPQASAITCRAGSGAVVSQDTATWKQADLAVTAGVQTVLWTVSANLSSAELDRVEFFPQWTFSTWAAQNALAGLPTNAVRAADDSDGDGAAGLLEYAFGLDPGAADFSLFTGSLTGPENARGLPVLRVARALDGRDYLELHFPRRVNSGLTWQMQAAADPAATWENTGTLEVLRPLGADWELCRTRDTQPLDPARPRRLVRLRVTQP